MEFEILLRQKNSLLQSLEEAVKQQMRGIKEETYGARNSQLIFKLLLESKDLIAVAARFVKLYHRMRKSNGGFFVSCLEKRSDRLERTSKLSFNLKKDLFTLYFIAKSVT